MDCYYALCAGAAGVSRQICMLHNDLQEILPQQSCLNKLNQFLVMIIKEARYPPLGSPV